MLFCSDLHQDSGEKMHADLMLLYQLNRKDVRQDLDQAEKYFREATECSPHDSDALCDLAHFLSSKARVTAPPYEI